jgi:serine phosphatase RsbU (regulator of sigma subunit)
MALQISPPNAVCGGPVRFDASRELSKLANAQRRLLPQRAPEIRGYELVLAYRPAYVATGDYHDFFHRPDGGMAAFVGDGSGHGPAACMLVATMRTILRTYPDRQADPGTTLTFAGRTFSALTSSAEFMTGVSLVLEGEGRVAWASAGHDPPLRVSRSGQVAAVDLTPVGLPLGIEPGEVYQTVRWQLEPGERLLLFTDGLVEATGRKGEMFGRARLVSEVSGLSHVSLQEMVRELVVRTAEHCDGIGFADDFTILGVERRTGAGTSSPEAEETSGSLSGVCG